MQNMSGGFIIKLAADAANQYIRHQELPPLPSVLPPELLRQAACYVSIFENPGWHFRSMYGSPMPRQANLAQEVMVNTAQAIMNSNTNPFRQIDLTYLAYSVSVLGPLERITSVNNLQPQTHGLYLRSDRGKTAVILPARIGIETAEDQLATGYRELGVNTREEAVTLYRFAVTQYQ